MLKFTVLLAAYLVAAAPAAGAFEWGGFGDVRYRQSTNRENPYRNGFAKGLNFDLYAAKQIDENADALVELAFHPDGDGEEAHIERLQLSYSVADWLKVRAGRFHTLLGYWNQAYHHGAFLETTIDRPAFLEYEHFNGLLPLHSVGLWVEGRLKADAVPWTTQYGLMLANSPKVESMPNHLDAQTMLYNIDQGIMPMAILNPQNVGDQNTFNAVGARVEFKPNALPGLLFGFSGYRSRVMGSYDNCPTLLNAAPGAPCPTEINVPQWVVGPHLRLSQGRFEFLSEVFKVYDRDNKALPGVRRNYTHTMGYVQSSFEVVRDRVIPYARYERTTVDSLDPYMTALQGGTQFRWIEGLRFNIGHTALKLEARQVRMHMPTMMDMNGAAVPDHFNYFRQYATQWSFYF